MTKQITVVVDGREVDFDAAVELTDEDLRRELHSRMLVSTADLAAQEWCDAYAELHLATFGQVWVVA